MKNYSERLLNARNKLIVCLSGLGIIPAIINLFLGNEILRYIIWGYELAIWLYLIGWAILSNIIWNKIEKEYFEIIKDKEGTKFYGNK